MKANFCYWSVAEGDDLPRIERAIRSARAVGVAEPFHVWSPQPISGAIHHPCRPLDVTEGIYKLVFLHKAVTTLAEAMYVWLDPAHYFVRQPESIPSLLRGSPVHVPLEGNLNAPSAAWRAIRGVEPAQVAAWMRDCGVRSRTVFAVSGGFFVIRQDVINTLYDLTQEFWQFCLGKGVRMTYEPLLAYAMQMLCGNPHGHTLRGDHEYWAWDHDRVWRDRVPDGTPWRTVDCLGLEPYTCNPAIVQLSVP